MKDLTIIIPLHEYKKDYLDRALKSVATFTDSKISLVGPQTVLDEVKSNSAEIIGDIKHITFVPNTTDSYTFCDNMNIGVFACTTPYFCILEFDDIITPTWFKNVSTHINSYRDVSAFLPMIELVNDKNPEMISIANELAWSTSFVEELGYLDNEALKSYYDFSVSGGVFKTEDYISIGGLKPSLSIASTYEFLLRMTHNSKKVYIIPKIGCVHTYGRDGSFMVASREIISQEHGEWLIKTAQQEMFFKEDRNKTFEA